MFCITRPSLAALERYRVCCQERSFNFPSLGLASLDAAPQGFTRDSYGCVLAVGKMAYTRATAAIDAWAMYPRHWTSVYAKPGRLQVDAVYIASISGYGLVSLLPGRVLEVFDEHGPRCRYGFTFGTLVGHVEQGVERFEVSWSAATDEVRFDVTAISRPGPMLRIVAPLARRLQLRFHREAMTSMLAYVAQAMYEDKK